ncbi:MAG: Serine/threonine-protein kinase PknB [Pseudomonadota bacterium]|jgi:serine/threonine protein kinase
MKRFEPGHVLDGFVVKACIHAGSMAHIYSVERQNPLLTQRAGQFPLVMKVPRMTAGDGAENLIGFEIEQQILPALSGPHVPRFVASGDLSIVPYLVMEHIEGRTLETWIQEGQRLPLDEAVHLGQLLAQAVHQLHLQHVCHLDLKPSNVVYRMAPDASGRADSAVLLDFGLSHHAHHPDLLAEEMRKAVGSATWMSPEQVVGVRGDPRSDVFAMGVVLYQMTTGLLPFGSPVTTGGLRQRLWMDPVPPRAHNPEVPEWLQEVVLRCLAPEADARYPSAAHLAFDLTHPQQVPITERGRRTRGTGFWPHLKRWLRAAGKHYAPSPLPAEQIQSVPIVMVAMPHKDVSDATLYALRLATERNLGFRPGARLAVVTVIASSDTDATDENHSETQVHRLHLARMQQWASALDMAGHQLSCHVLESGDVAHALLQYARGNHVSIIVMGAATHGLQLQHVVATVPIKVAMHAPCTVTLVKASLPFEALATPAQP